MPCYSPLKGFKSLETGGLVFRGDQGVGRMEVACGQCLGCRLDRSRTWAMRIVHEASLYPVNSFITLTYRDVSECDDDQLARGYHIPADWSLHKSHFQKFMKRLRKSRSGELIRFFHCGEYGNRCEHGLDLAISKCPLCSVGRPHYHGCLFNCGFSDLESYSISNGITRFTSKSLSDLWRYGFVDVGELNYQSASYVARYVLKKVTGVKADDHYTRIDFDGVMHSIEPEYVTMSRRPGIGRNWFNEFASDCFPSDEVPVVGMGVVKKVPRYYEELYKVDERFVGELEKVKALRQVFRREHIGEYTPERLMAKYKVKKAQVSLLKRSL